MKIDLMPCRDVVCLGELLIDFVSTTTDVPLADCPSFHKAPGGAPANVAAGLAKLGVSAGFIGKVGDDPFGDLLRATLDAAGVDTSCLIKGRHVRTSLAFVANRSDGRKEIAFWRHPGADMLLSVDDLDFGYIGAARVFHFGSVSLSHLPSRDATLAAARAARAAGLLVSFDPNLRLPLWESGGDARHWIWEAMQFAHVVKLAEEEWEFVTGVDSFEKGNAKIRAAGPQLAVMTSGQRGCSFATSCAQGVMPAFAVDAVDALGAGDAFVAGMIRQFLALDCPMPAALGGLTSSDLTRIMTYASACGAWATQKLGAIPALPMADEVEDFMRGARRTRMIE